MQSIIPIGSEQEENMGNVENPKYGNSEYLARPQLQLPQDPIIAILMMPLIHLNQIMTQINRMIATTPSPFTPMQSTTPSPFTPMQSTIPSPFAPTQSATHQGGLKITELRRDSAGNIVSIVEKW